MFSGKIEAIPTLSSCIINRWSVQLLCPLNCFRVRSTLPGDGRTEALDVTLQKTRYMAYIDDTIMAGQCSCHRSFLLLFTRPLLLSHLSYLVSFWLCWRLASTHGSGLVSCRNSSRTHLTARHMTNCHNFSFARKLFKVVLVLQSFLNSAGKARLTK
jgi:hypothetical protein